MNVIQECDDVANVGPRLRCGVPPAVVCLYEALRDLGDVAQRWNCGTALEEGWKCLCCFWPIHEESTVSIGSGAWDIVPT